ncbi:hypothetical protein ACRAQ6_01015 [Erythrobacter sp. HA6-11]
MENKDDAIHIEDDDAMAAHTTGHMRWVLGIGLFLAIAILSLIWITGALSQGEVEERATVSGTQEAMSDDGVSDEILVPDETVETLPQPEPIDPDAGAAN